jgi:ZIP family zinc transporter
MLEAGLWGLGAAAGLIVGAIAAAWFDLPRQLVALVMGFGSGALMSAVAFDLAAEAHAGGGTAVFAIGVAIGAVVYFVGNRLLARIGSSGKEPPSEGTIAATSGPAIVLGTVLDGVPESIILGASLLAGGSMGISFLVAVFLSNVPEAVSGTRDLRDEGHGRRRILLLWVVVAVSMGIVAAAAYGLMGGMTDEPLGVVQAFAAGAILVLLADTMMPEAFEYGGDLVGLSTALGFASAFLLAVVTPG